jgi:hypothetical protein
MVIQASIAWTTTFLAAIKLSAEREYRHKMGINAEGLGQGKPRPQGLGRCHEGASMSMGEKASRYVEEILEVTGKTMEGSYVCCLGHLNTRPDSRAYYKKKYPKANFTYKNHLRGRGINAVEIDINGQEGSFPEDLGRLITNDKLIGKFDIIVDGGTGEHIDNQRWFWTNVCNLLKVGGVSIHILPYRNSFLFHSTWRYDIMVG